MTLSEAIARFEGFHIKGSVAQRNNNPGNLRDGPRKTGTDAKGYAIYATVADGWADLQRLIDKNIARGLTLREFFGGQRDATGKVIKGGYPGYAPAADSNDPGHYAVSVAKWIGISPDVPLNAPPANPVPSSVS